MRHLKTAISVILFAAAAAVLYFAINGGLLFAESPQPEFIIMPESELAGNPVLFRSEDGTVSVPEIDRTNAKELISSISRPETMVWECRRTLYAGGYSQTRAGIYRKLGDKYRVEVRTAGGQLAQTVIFNGTRVQIRSQSGAQRYAQQTGQYRPETVMGMTGLEFFMQADDENIITAELRLYEQKSCLYIEYRMPEISQTEHYYISLNYGVVMRAECYNGSQLVYSAETTALSDEAQEEWLFEF